MKPFRLRPSVDACARPPAGHGRWLRVGECVFDPARNELARGAQNVALDPKLSATLLYLARHAGHVVARDELQIELSPVATLCDRALTQAVAKLRRLLGDTATQPRYIETVARRGYRLVAPVSWVSRDPRAHKPSAFARIKRCAAEYMLFALAFVAVAAMLLTAAWQARRNSDDVDALVAAVASVRPIDSLPLLAVGAFGTAGAAPEDAQLARALRTHLMVELGRIQSIRVLPADGALPPSRPGRGRNAPVLSLDGHLRRAGDRVGAEVRLTVVESGRTLLIETFERPYSDLLGLQDEILFSLRRALASELPVSLPADASRLTRSVPAYEQYVQAQALMRDERSIVRARGRYWRAVQLDGSFARAYAGLALTYAAETRHGVAGDKELDLALELARTAEQIDAAIPEIHWVLAWVHGQRRNHVDALKHLRKALALNSSFAEGYGLLGSILIDMGHAARAVEILKAALQLNPNGGFLNSLLLGRALFHAGDHAQAAAHLRVAVERSPGNLESLVYFAAALAQAGQQKAAEWAIEDIRTISPDFALEPWLAEQAVSDSKTLGTLGSALRSLGL